MYRLLVVIVLAVCAYAQKVDNLSVHSNVSTIDFSSAATTRVMKTGTTAPATCTIGDLFYDTDATAGQNLYGCTSTNVWTQQAGGSSGGSGATTPNAGCFISSGTSCTATHSANLTNIRFVVTSCNDSDDESLVFPSSFAYTANTVTFNFSNTVTNVRCTVNTSGSNSTRQITFILGADNATSVLADTDDQPTIWWNRLGGGVTITEVGCESDAGTPTMQLQKDDGSPANILSSSLTCTTSGATTTTFASTQNAIASGNKIDFLMATAGGTAKRITVTIKYTID